jgi:hypothetical protein
MARWWRCSPAGAPPAPSQSPASLLILHRRFSPLAGAGAAITRVDLAPALTADPPSQPLPATLIARWQPPFTVDNMEGLALARVGNRRFLYVISDDNLNSLQRTVLMKFELPEAP